MSDAWQTIDSAPKDGSNFLATDGVLLGVASYWSQTEPDTTFLGYDEGVRYENGGLKIGPRFMEIVPNPKAGTFTEGWSATAFFAWDSEVETTDEENDPVVFKPTHWMPMLAPPAVLSDDGKAPAKEGSAEAKP